MQKVILIGYMAVGKTTIAQLLAIKMKWKWVDLDKTIEKKMNLSIKELFQQKGEIYFRRIEHEVFKELVENNERLIISTGGGTPCYANNHLFLNGDAVFSVYLQASIPVIFERLKKAKSERPLVANQTEDELKKFIAKNLFDRSYFYNQATVKINVDTKTPEEITDEIGQLLN
ncbi:shikimate kinase [Flavobacterium sp. RSB2_4_14]|uniref:shikimate kinase n=1 Tax=Flavobacterium sp. RSB2_4_14 TaxID=3447665 RepID=UPI003F32311C